jgi:Amt family ammonium transporter
MAVDQEIADAINLLWVFVAGIMCFLLQAGFGLLEAGSVQAKNAQNIMIKNLMDAAVAALAYWA